MIDPVRKSWTELEGVRIRSAGLHELALPGHRGQPPAAVAIRPEQVAVGRDVVNDRGARVSHRAQPWVLGWAHELNEVQCRLTGTLAGHPVLFGFRDFRISFFGVGRSYVI